MGFLKKYIISVVGRGVTAGGRGSLTCIRATHVGVGGCHICRLGSFGGREGLADLGKDPEDVIDRPRDTLGGASMDMYLQIDHTPIHTSDERMALCRLGDVDISSFVMAGGSRGSRYFPFVALVVLLYFLLVRYRIRGDGWAALPSSSSNTVNDPLMAQCHKPETCVLDTVNCSQP